MPLGGGRGSVGDSSLVFSCYHSLPFLTFFYRDFCAIPPKYDDENLGGGFSGQLLGFGGELVTLLFLYHPKTQRGLYPFRVPTSMRRTRSRFRQSRNRRE